jgi:hypothetical protein
MKSLLIFLVLAVSAFAAQHTVLQVEFYSEGGFLPDPTKINPEGSARKIEITEFNDGPRVRENWGVINGLAGRVGERFYGPGSNSYRAGLVKQVIVQEAGNYAHRSMGVGVPDEYLSQIPFVLPTKPKYPWVVECHAYGFSDVYGSALNYPEVFGRMDTRINRDNVVAIVACCNRGGSLTEQGLWRVYWNYCKDAIKVGLRNGNIDTQSSAPATWPDIVTGDDYTSWAAGSAADAAVCIVDVFVEAKVPYTPGLIKEIMKGTADWLPEFGDRGSAAAKQTYGAGLLNLPAAIDSAKRKVGQLTKPPVVETPPPVPAPAPAVKLTRISAKAAYALIKQGWYCVTPEKGALRLLNPQGVAVHYLTADDEKRLRELIAPGSTR